MQMTPKQAIEEAIDEAGRDRVFEIARANGWDAGTAPPKYVWYQINDI